MEEPKYSIPGKSGKNKPREVIEEIVFNSPVAIPAYTSKPIMAFYPLVCNWLRNGSPVQF